MDSDKVAVTSLRDIRETLYDELVNMGVPKTAITTPDQLEDDNDGWGE